MSTLYEDSAILRQSLPMQYNINQELDGAVTYHMVYVFHKKRLITLECTSMTIMILKVLFGLSGYLVRNDFKSL